MQGKEVVYCPLKNDFDLTAVEEVQRKAWSLDDITIVPTHLFQAVCKYDTGLVVGALAGGKLIGFILALATSDKYTQHIHMIGVMPKWQGKEKSNNVGFGLLSCYQQAAMQRHVRDTTWTFDPLLGQNANLYFHKIGAKAVLYEPDAYGRSSETGIYQGLPTDRLLVKWRLEDKRETSVFSSENLSSVPVVGSATEIGGVCFAMEAPLDIQEVKKKNMEEACAIRLRTREIFMSAFARGYQVIDFVHDKREGRNFYVFG